MGQPRARLVLLVPFPTLLDQQHAKTVLQALSPMLTRLNASFVQLVHSLKQAFQVAIHVLQDHIPTNKALTLVYHAILALTQDMEHPHAHHVHKDHIQVYQQQGHARHVRQERIQMEGMRRAYHAEKDTHQKEEDIRVRNVRKEPIPTRQEVENVTRVDWENIQNQRDQWNAHFVLPILIQILWLLEFAYLNTFNIIDIIIMLLRYSPFFDCYKLACPSGTISKQGASVCVKGYSILDVNFHNTNLEIREGSKDGDSNMRSAASCNTTLSLCIFFVFVDFCSLLFLLFEDITLFIALGVLFL